MAALEVLDLFGGLIARRGCWSLGELEHARLLQARSRMRTVRQSFTNGQLFSLCTLC